MISACCSFGNLLGNLNTFSQYITRNSSVDKIAERYRLNHASIVQLYLYSIYP